MFSKAVSPSQANPLTGMKNNMAGNQLNRNIQAIKMISMEKVIFKLPTINIKANNNNLGEASCCLLDKG